ncbi:MULTISPECIES: GNAT family N-acetyltransferase [Streptomyces]|uniref:GNAT family N-acetyltransferase n=1 Tax=Streptomyces TaxID=1883 RepID=UPI0031DDD832
MITAVDVALVDAGVLAASGYRNAPRTDPRNGQEFTTLVALAEDGHAVGQLEGHLDDATHPLDDMRLSRPHAWISFISTTHRRAGAGRALMREFARRAHEAGATGIGLLAEYSDDRTGRITFFIRCGFTEAWPGTLRDIYVASPRAVLAACTRRSEQPSPSHGATKERRGVPGAARRR